MDKWWTKNGGINCIIGDTQDESSSDHSINVFYPLLVLRYMTQGDDTGWCRGLIRQDREITGN